jgi:signal transduction histidine kinase
VRLLINLSLSILLLLVCSGVVVVVAQENRCALTLGQSPELGGLRLGMTEEQVRARFKIIEREPADEYGVASLRLEPTVSQGTEAVRDISVESIKERIVSIRLVYRATASAADYRAFTASVSQSLRLPLAWKAVTTGSMVTEMMMECAGFKISARLIGAKIPVIYLSALEAEQTLSRRQAEKERRLREFFKP